MQSFRNEFGALLLSELKVLQRRALRLEPSAAAADDLVQDTVERALRACDRFTPGTNLRGWLLRIMSNLFVDRCRRRTFEVAGDALIPDIPAPDYEPPPAWTTVSEQQIAGAIPSLGPELGGVFRLYFEGTRSYRDLSERLGVPASTVGTRLLRARRRMRQLLAPEEGANMAPLASAHRRLPPSVARAA